VGREIRLIAATLLTSGLLLTANIGWGQETAAAVSEDLAHTLAASTLTPSARRLPGMRFDREKASQPEGFYWFEATANVPDAASPLLGYFAVNKVTGDVWNPVQCKKLASGAIRRFQDQLRKKAKISATEFRRIAEEAPCQP
jgi:hypothetical protein